MQNSAIILLTILSFNVFSKVNIDSIYSLVCDAVNSDSYLNDETINNIEKIIMILKNNFNEDSTKVGLALMQAYKIGWRKTYQMYNEFETNKERDSLLKYYEENSKNIFNSMFYTKDSTNRELIHLYCKFDYEKDTTERFKEKMAELLLSQPDQTIQDSALYIELNCIRKEKIEKICLKYKDAKFKLINYDELDIILYQCSKCLEDYISNKELLEFYFKRRDLAIAARDHVKGSFMKQEFEERINKTKQKIIEIEELCNDE